MEVKEKIILIGILVLIIVSAIGLRFLSSKTQVSSSDLPEGVYQYLNNHEFTDICFAWGKVYCSGVDGLFVIDPLTNEAEYIESELRFVRALEYDVVNNKLWVGHSKGIAIYNGAEFESTHYISEIDHTINEILIADKQVFIGTFKGLYVVVNDEVVARYTSGEGLLSDMVNRLIEDEYGNIWYGTYIAKIGGVGYISNKEVVKSFGLEDGLAHNAITSIVQFNHNQILVGGGVYTGGGASLLSLESNEWVITESIFKDDGLAGDKVRHIFISKGRNIWFCSEYDGVAIFDEKLTPLALVTTKEGLSDHEVKKIIEDDDGSLWMATRSGVTKFEVIRLKSLISDIIIL